MSDVWCVGLIVMKCFAAEPAPVTAGATFCQVVKLRDVQWHRNDTRGTKQNLDILVRKGKRLCGWGRK